MGGIEKTSIVECMRLARLAALEARKPITVALLRDLEKQVAINEISYSRMVEILNEKCALEAKVEIPKELDELKADMENFNQWVLFRLSKNEIKVYDDDDVWTYWERGNPYALKLSPTDLFREWKAKQKQ